MNWLKNFDKRDWVLLCILIIIIVFIFSGCTNKTTNDVEKGKHSLYTYQYDSCTYIGLGGYYMVHSETCKNPMHTCDCIDYKLENILELQ